MRASGRATIIRFGMAALVVAAALAMPVQSSIAAEEDPLPPFEEFSSEPVAVPVDIERGQSFEANVTLAVRSLEGGIIEVSADLGDGARFLTMLTSDFEGARQTADDRLEWRCGDAECSIAATVRVEAFTDLNGDLSIAARGGVEDGDVPADAEATVGIGEAEQGRARVFELSRSFLEYPDTGDQAPHGGLELIEYDLGDPSDEVQLVLRPLLGSIELEMPAGGPAPTWAQGLVPIANSTTCFPECAGSALVRMGPSDFSNLEYQILAYSDRPGAGATATVERTAATSITQIDFVTMTPQQPVAAIPITVSGPAERTRLMADVGVRGRSSFVRLRPAGDTSFEPATHWVIPDGDTEYELAISTPDTQAGDVEMSWTIALFKIPGEDTAAATFDVGAARVGAFTVGGIGDPGEFTPLDEGGDGGGFPWLLAGAGAVAAVALTGGAWQYRRRSS